MAPYCSTSSWACSVSGSGSFTHGAQSDGSVVTVCAKSVVTTVKPTPPKPAPPKVAPPKPTPPKVAAPKTTPPKLPVVQPVVVAKPVVRPVAKPVVKPVSKPVAKPVPSPKPNVQVSTASKVGQASFAPDALAVTVDSNVLSIAETANFATSASEHFRSAIILGRLAEVRFSPTTTAWVFGDSTSGSTGSHAYFRAATYRVTATQTYMVSYLFQGESVWQPSGQVTTAGSLTVQVVGSEQPASPPLSVSKIRLVSGNCLQHPAAYGCGP